MSPPLDLRDVKKKLEIKRVYPKSKPMEIVWEGASAPTYNSDANLIPALECGNHRRIDDQLFQVRDKL